MEYTENGDIPIAIMTQHEKKEKANNEGSGTNEPDADMMHCP